MEQFDFIIIGAGSAGCVLAGKLSKLKSMRILILEAGGMDHSPWLHVPIGYAKTFYHNEVNWQYETVSEISLNNRSGYWPRGRVVGGSGAINAMIYARGLPKDFDDWVAEGAVGWDWSLVNACYERMETNISSSGERTGAGPVTVQDVSDQVHSLSSHFFRAANELGYREHQDYNQPPFVGASTYRINTYKGFRNASSRAFLKPALKCKNITLRTSAHVDQLSFQNKRATSVRYTWNGQEHVAEANMEIILSAGSIASPTILERSGIGDSERLKQHGISTYVDNPNVGAHLQDHLGISYYFKATKPTLNDELFSWSGRIRALSRYILNRRGPLALSVNQCGGYFFSHPGLPHPDQQLYFNPVTYTTTPSGTRTIINTDPFSGFVLGFSPTRPSSRGCVHISSCSPTAKPIINPNSLGTDEDLESVISGAKLCQSFIATSALKSLIDEPFVSDLASMSDKQMLEDFRQRSGTVFHPVGTCRMGKSAKNAVVDNKLRLFGIDGLRVVDASVFPNITSANTNAPTMVLAWRAAELILEEHG